jgi:hypothetical protein
MPRRLKQLPMITLAPTLRPKGSFGALDVQVDSDESTAIYLHIYGYGMDVTAHLDREQLELLKKRTDDALECLSDKP